MMHYLSVGLDVFGLSGLLIFLLVSGSVMLRYQPCHSGSFRWHLRNRRLKQITAIACLFCLAMTASYGILYQPWALLYLIIACKTGAWWLRFIISQRA